MWSMLGARAGDDAGVGKLRRRLGDRRGQAAQARCRRAHAPTTASCPTSTQIDRSNDVVFTWNGTTSGVRVPDADWIAGRPQGPDHLPTRPARRSPRTSTGTRSMSPPSAGRRCSAARAAHGVLILGPRAVERLESDTAAAAAAQDLPPDQKRQADRGHFQGRDDQHALDAGGRGLRSVALEWAEGVGGLDGADRARRRQCRRARPDRSQSADWLEHLAADPAIRSNTSVCLQFADRSTGADAATSSRRSPSCSKQEGAAYDIAGYRDAPPGLRIWCGATVDTADIEALGPWLDWAWDAELTSSLRAGLHRPTDPASHDMQGSMTKPKVLISDKMDPNAAAIFRERGIEVDEITGQTPDELKAIIGDYDGLAIRSLDQGHQGDPRRRDQPQGRSAAPASASTTSTSRPPRRKRRRGHEHAVRQLDHHRRARHRADVRARPPAARSRRLDPGRQVGEEPLHGRRGHRQDARPDRRRQHRLDRRRPRARPAR